MISRLGIALVLGVLGFVTGMILVDVFELPGVVFPGGTSLWVGGMAGIACLVAGYVYSDRTLDALGEIWRVLWELSVGILATLRALIR